MSLSDGLRAAEYLALFDGNVFFFRLTVLTGQRTLNAYLIMPPPRGPRNHFQGLKGQFLHERGEAFKAATDRGQFYAQVTQTFIQNFGYKLKYEENPRDGTDLTTLKPIPLEELPVGDQKKEGEERQKYYHGLYKVSFATNHSQ